MAVTRVVTVVLPLVPVMATTRGPPAGGGHPGGQLDLGPYRDPGGGGGDENGVADRHARARHHQIACPPGDRPGPVRPAWAPQSRRWPSPPRRRPAGSVVEHHDLVARSARSARATARPGHAEPDDRDATAAHPVPPLDRKSA